MGGDDGRDDDDAWPDERGRARDAVLDLLASSLDAALPLVTDVRRDARLREIAAACAQIGFLGEAARRLAA